MSDLIAKFASGEFDLHAAKTLVKDLYDALRGADWLNSGIEFLKGVWAPLPSAILLAVAVLMLLFGKKMMGVWKFLGMFCLGYAASVVLLVNTGKLDTFFIPGWIVALIIGGLAAVLSKYIYLLAVAGASFAAGYVLIVGVGPRISGLSSWMEASDTNRWIAIGVAAALVMIFVFLLLKWVEILGTAVVGAWFAAYFTNAKFFEFTSLADMGTVVVPGLGEQSVLFLIAVGVLFLLGAAAQIKTRRRY